MGWAGSSEETKNGGVQLSSARRSYLGNYILQPRTPSLQISFPLWRRGSGGRRKLNMDTGEWMLRYIIRRCCWVLATYGARFEINTISEVWDSLSFVPRDLAIFRPALIAADDAPCRLNGPRERSW